MPLSCLYDNIPLASFLLSDDDWNALKANYHNLHLSMRCCSSAVIPKLSRLGTRFFAHKSRKGCQSATESPAHLKAKFIIAESARAAGWQVFTEESGADPDGNSWIADVLCTRRKAKVAFEIQLAAQTGDEYQARQKRYALSDVRCLWLIRPRRKGSGTEPFPPSRDLPLVLINVQNSANMTVEVGEAPPIALADFVKGALGGELFWAEAHPGRFTVELQIASIGCWKCLKPIKAARGYVINNHFVPLAEVSDTETLATFLLALHKSDSEVTPVSQWYSRTTQNRYFAAACPFCSALLGNWPMTMDFFTEITNCGYPDCGCPDAVHYGREIGCRVFVYHPITLRIAASELSDMPIGEWLWRPFTRGAHPRSR